MKLGNITAKAAGVAADAVGGVLSDTVYPETEYGLAAYLFERIAVQEKDTVNRDRAYYLSLMEDCLNTVRAAGNDS
jgi:hypothetical protein